MPSSIASKMIEEKFPDQPNPIREQTVYVVFAAPEGERLEDPGNMEAADAVVAGIKNNIDQLTADEMLVNPVRLNPELQRRVVETGTSSGLPQPVAEATASLHANRAGTTAVTVRFDDAKRHHPENHQVFPRPQIIAFGLVSRQGWHDGPTAERTPEIIGI